MSTKGPNVINEDFWNELPPLLSEDQLEDFDEITRLKQSIKISALEAELKSLREDKEEQSEIIRSLLDKVESLQNQLDSSRQPVFVLSNLSQVKTVCKPTTNEVQTPAMPMPISTVKKANSPS